MIFSAHLERAMVAKLFFYVFLEDWRQALDKNLYTAAILMDLSKAFDCLPHNILLEKLSAYGLSSNSVHLFSSYLSNRKQQIKIGNIMSSWER